MKTVLLAAVLFFAPGQLSFNPAPAVVPARFVTIAGRHHNGFRSYWED
jgi:hypothetical protein